MTKRFGALALLLFVCFFAQSAYAANYRAWAWHDGHRAAADSCLVELSSRATVAQVAGGLAAIGKRVQAVTLADGIPVLADDLKSVDVYTGDDIVIAVVEIDPRRDLDSELAKVAAVPGVATVTPNWIHAPLLVPNDPYFQIAQLDMRQIDMEKAWDLGFGAGVTVAVIDTGYVSSGLQDGAKHVKAGYNFNGHNNDTNDMIGHGTHVSHTIAENTNNGIGCAGIAAEATIFPLKVFPDDGSGALESDILSAIVYAMNHGANVINMSLGGGGYDGAMASAIAACVTHNIVVVAAAGNDGTATISYPAAYPACIAVGASNPHQPGGAPSRASFSSYGQGLAVVAPGVAITQETRGPYGGISYVTMDGTSMASPHVAGTAALLIGRGGADAPAIRQALQSTAHNPAGKWTADLGYGEIDAYAALLAYKGVNKPPVAQIFATPTSGPAPLSVRFDGRTSHDPDGTIVQYAWRLQSTNQTISTEPMFTQVFNDSGAIVVELTVTDDRGASAIATATIEVTSANACDALLQTVYDVCGFSLIFNMGQPVDGQTAQQMCESDDPADAWACLETCRAAVDNCSDLANCALQKCNVGIHRESHSSSSKTHSGCGV